MKVTLENDQYIVIDDFLDKEVFDKLHLQLDSLAYVRLVYGHDKVYKASCGDIYKNDKKYWYDKPEKSPKYIQLFMDAVHSAGENEAKNVINSDFTNFGMLVHAYRAGAELSWHIDAMQFKGAYSYYVHKEWSHTWGGNLLLAHPDTTFDVFTDPGPDIKTEGLYDWSGRTVHWFDTEHERRQVLNPGVGTYVMPLPNRIVIAKTRVVHHVERIDQAAGDHFRLSMTGFFE